MNSEITLNDNKVTRKVKVKKVSIFYLALKRVFDIISSFTAIVLLLPVFVVLYFVVKFEDFGPVFYKHKRIGQNGKIIYIHKFRSMVKNSNELTKLLTKEQLEQYEKEFKLDDDPRITKCGKFLRKTSLDELPQLFDILLGRISVVGPRPLVEKEIDLYYNDTKDELLSCKPGLTGYWQAYARNDAEYETGERQEMEYFYIENRSLWLDIKIIFKTVFSVLSRKGAK